MSIEQQARALMMRHHHAIKNRQQSMLERSAAELGIENENLCWTTIQGQPQPGFRNTYDRSGATLS
jgi:hypothetical protein